MQTQVQKHFRFMSRYPLPTCPPTVPLEAETRVAVNGGDSKDTLDRTTPSDEQKRSIQTALKAVNAAGRAEDVDRAADEAIANAGNVGGGVAVNPTMRAAQASFQAQQMINRERLDIYQPPPRVLTEVTPSSKAINDYLTTNRFVPGLRLQRQTTMVGLGRPRNLEADRSNSVRERELSPWPKSFTA